MWPCYSFVIIIMFGLSFWLVPGIVGGTITAVVIKWADTRIPFARLLLIAFGWIAGMVMGGIAGTLLNQLFYELGDFDYQLPLTVSFAVTGMITALIGSWTTYKILESTVVTKDAG